MIFDRTENDVENAREVLKKLISFQELSEEDIESLERGTITINTLNRIEQKQKELSELFVSIGYYFKPFETKQWSYEEIFNEDNFSRIIENGEVLREAFFTYASTPSKALPRYHYSELNAVENLLFDLQSMYEYVVQNTKECGNIECGEA